MKTELPTLEGELSQEAAALVTEMASRGLAEVLGFCLTPLVSSDAACVRPFTAIRLQTAMRRFVAVAWMLHSEMLVGEDGKPLSLDQLGKIPQLDCTKCSLSLLAKKFSERFKFRSRVQKLKYSKPNYAAGAKTGWAKRRARQAA